MSKTVSLLLSIVLIVRDGTSVVDLLLVYCGKARGHGVSDFVAGEVA